MLNHESSSGVSQCYSCSEFKVYQINEFNFKMYKMLFCGSMTPDPCRLTPSCGKHSCLYSSLVYTIWGCQ